MAVWDWFLGLFKSDGTLSMSAYCGEIAAEVFYKELAIQSCENLISNAISRAEFLTYENGKEVRKENYYLLNVEPNQNKSASKFWRDIIHKLIYENECLVIQQGEKFYVADSFDTEKFAFKENIYKNIVIDNYELNDSFIESQVFHFELHNQKIRSVLDGLYNSYGKLIQSSTTNYKRSKAKRGTLDVPTNYTQTQKGQADLTDLLNNRFKKFFEAEGGAVLPLTNGSKYTEIESNNNSRGVTEGRDIRAFIDDIFDFVAIGFQMPPQLLKGNVVDTDKAINNFITFCVNPIAKLITDEVNRKLYKKELYLRKTYAKLDTTRIKVVELKDIANTLDVLTRIGAYCVDDSLRVLGMEPLGTEWSKVRWMTKNYERIEERLKGDG